MKKIILFVLSVLVFGLGAVGVWLNSDFYAYQKAVKAFESEDYEEAAVLFEEIVEYKDSSELLNESQYQIASQLFKMSDYLEAIELYAELGDYKNSYNFLNTSYYNLGHEAYLAKEYDQATEYFNKMDKTLGIGVPHFMTYEEGRDYIVEQALEGAMTIRLYMASFGPVSDDYSLWYKFSYLTMSEDASIQCDENDGYVEIEPMYYPGAKVVIASKNGKLDLLTKRENQLYEKAMSLVQQAKQETTTEVELERWLNDWLCKNVEYLMTYDENLYDSRFPDDWTAYGAIIEGQANCQGYADAFYLLASLAGFNVRYQFGEGNDGGHVWNAIELNGQWYYIDTTWNDTGYNPYQITYAYFNYVEGALKNQKPHDFAKIVETAETIDPELDYYELNQCSFNTLKEAARYAISQKLNKRQSEVHFKVNIADLDNDDLISVIRPLLQNYGYNLEVVSYQRADSTCYILYWKSLYQ